MTSQEYMQQIRDMGAAPTQQSLQQQVTAAYDAPVLRPIINEQAQLESQYLPSLFEPFTRMGTGAADMSPAAKLAAIGGSLGRLNSRIGANNSIQGFYGNQIGNIVQGLGNDWQNRNQSLWQQYNATAQQEQAAKDEAFRQQQLDLQRSSAAAAQRAAEFPAFQGGISAQPDERYLRAQTLVDQMKQITTQMRAAGNNPALRGAYNAQLGPVISQLRGLGFDTSKLTF